MRRIKRAGVHWKEGSPIQETSGVSNKKQTVNNNNNKQMWTLARVKRTSDSKLRTKIIHNNNTGGKTEGVSIRGVMRLKFWISTKRKKMELSTLVAQRASKKGQYKRKNKNGPKHKGWWKRPTTTKMNTKRKNFK